MARQRRGYQTTPEWRTVGRSPLVRFRPHRAQPREGWDITLPLARAAVRGRLCSILGRNFGRCIALESLRLPRKRSGSPVGSVDLLLLSKSGDVVLAECKRAGNRLNLRYVRKAMKQLIKYERGLQKSPKGWLDDRIETSYTRFAFPDFGVALQRLGVKPGSAHSDWKKRVERNCRRGNRGQFLVAGPGSRRRRRSLVVWPVGPRREITS